MQGDEQLANKNIADVSGMATCIYCVDLKPLPQYVARTKTTTIIISVHPQPFTRKAATSDNKTEGVRRHFHKSFKELFEYSIALEVIELVRTTKFTSLALFSSKARLLLPSQPPLQNIIYPLIDRLDDLLSIIIRIPSKLSPATKLVTLDDLKPHAIQKMNDVLLKVLFSFLVPLDLLFFKISTIFGVVIQASLSNYSIDLCKSGGVFHIFKYLLSAAIIPTNILLSNLILFFFHRNLTEYVPSDQCELKKCVLLCSILFSSLINLCYDGFKRALAHTSFRETSQGAFKIHHKSEFYLVALIYVLLCQNYALLNETLAIFQDEAYLSKLFLYSKLSRVQAKAFIPV
ncbi:hypothetical protein KAFR_0B03560 [Kazachstania africana CBS 2517]|uniref:Uncharacterized protein n=1 Tax=Kazachstania africana (strain ATCC 22294 / BCRC 22015 / CBS 2517 / CECT 1963 / NBRC 1671 / NRRL Y-8276) TaxID=1071382 RepID=H2AQK3_KAZAF|nr:hypothetical protein KAFR_0B03560 [Kazachstania africana CBS 2517]CCF56653.1 hypothetical protein KAFR_0B03560 [Kazachstania africana CBS 2517]